VRATAKVAAALLISCALAGCNRVLLAPARPNVLLVTIDTLRADHVGAYGAGFAETPTLDALAAEGTRFSRAFASSPLTLPSHAALLTGRQPHQIGVRHNGMYTLAPAEESLPERLRDAGWATGAFVGAWVLAARFGLDQGFDRYDDATSAGLAAPGGYAERRADAVSDAALAWLESAPRPFFLWAHYYDPHASYRPPAPYAERFAGRLYDGEIAWVDAQLGRLVAALRARGELDRTLVVVTSDHGESLGEHDELTHGYTLHDAVLRVPLVLRGPGVPAGRVVDPLVRSVDVAPTVLAWLGQDGLAATAGHDLRPLWQGADPAERVAYSETLATELELGWSPLFSIRTRRFRYVQAPRPELYDLESDPAERENLLEGGARTHAAEASALAALLGTTLAESVEASPASLEPEALDRLHALGYALPAEPVAPTGLDPKQGLRALRELFDAQAALAEGDLARARTLVERILDAMPGSSRARAVAAELELRSGQPRLALAHIEEAARLAPRSAQHRAMLGEIRRGLGDEAGAQEAFRRAESLDPREPLVQVWLVEGRLRAGDLEGAAEHARLALEGDRGDALARIKIGKLWSGAGQHERALAALEEAVRIDPGPGYGHMLLAIESAHLGRAAQADLHRARAGELARDPWLLARLGTAWAAHGDLARAAAVLDELGRLHPAHAAQRRLAGLLGALQRAGG
jgi:arylsulfatase A-like enzyme/Flp pilus assembly protein TadD